MLSILGAPSTVRPKPCIPNKVYVHNPGLRITRPVSRRRTKPTATLGYNRDSARLRFERKLRPMCSVTSGTSVPVSVPITPGASSPGTAREGESRFAYACRQNSHFSGKGRDPVWRGLDPSWVLDRASVSRLTCGSSERMPTANRKPNKALLCCLTVV